MVFMAPVPSVWQEQRKSNFLEVFTLILQLMTTLHLLSRHFSASANFFPNVVLSPSFAKASLLPALLPQCLKGTFQVEM